MRNHFVSSKKVTIVINEIRVAPLTTIRTRATIYQVGLLTEFKIFLFTYNVFMYHAQIFQNSFRKFHLFSNILPKFDNFSENFEKMSISKVFSKIL